MSVSRPKVVAEQSLRVERDGRPTLDLARNTRALFGLVFDVLSLDEAVVAVQAAATERRRCFVSTPNINFVAMAQSDPEFRGSVLRSDLSLADGAPVVWAARLAGAPLPERVAGSDLFERLRHGAVPMRVYFFGGPDGVAAQAVERLNAESGPLRGVGYAAPGFGSIEAMSGDERLQRIECSGGNFLVVALGARKGQAWIERNLERLPPMVVCHLGAVVNFVAGRVERAPAWVGRIGFEWLWRIAQEPALWRRYAADALMLARLLTTTVLPLAVARLLPQSDEPASLERMSAGGETVLRLRGAWCADRLMPLKAAMADILRAGHTLRVDLSLVTHIDSATIALLLQVDAWQRTPRLLVDQSISRRVRRSLHLHGARDLWGS